MSEIQDFRFKKKGTVETNSGGAVSLEPPTPKIDVYFRESWSTVSSVYGPYWSTDNMVSIFTKLLVQGKKFVNASSDWLNV